MLGRRLIASFAFLAVLTALSCRTAVLEAPEPEGREERENPEERNRWFWEQRAYPAGSIPIAAHRSALLRESARTLRLSADDGTWTNIGPAPLPELVYSLASSQDVSGRASTLAIHPGNPDTMLLGTAEGGIWKTTDRGANWRSVGQDLPTLVVGVIRFSPSDPGLVFAGTGEARGAGPLRGFGLARSRDGGETWQLLPASGSGWDFNFTAITGLHVDPRDGKTLYLTTATIAPRTLNWTLPANLPQTGIFKSTDDGESWQLLHAAKRHPVSGSMSNGFSDFEYGGAAAPNLMYVSEYHGGIIRSTDGGATWRYVTPLKAAPGYGTFPANPSAISYQITNNRFQLANRLPNPASEVDFRIIEIAAAPSDPQVLYAGYDALQVRLDVNGNGIFDASDRRVNGALLFKSTDAGETWSWLGTRHDGVPDYCGFQCWYDNVISVHPANPDDVILGGAANYSRYAGEPFANPARLLELPWRGVLYQSRDGGKSWSDITPHCTQISAEPARTQAGVPVYPCVAVSNAKIVHPDIHVIVRGADGRVYVAGDGGVFRGSLPGPGSGHKRRAVAPRRLPDPLAGGIYTWETLNNGLSTLQFYRIAAHPDDPNILLGGLQDNSAAYWNGSEWQGWGAADGTVAFFHPVDPKRIYLGTQFEVHRHDDGGTKEFSEAAGWKLSVFAGEEFDLNNGETTSFVPVFALDPVDPSITYGASDRALYRSTERGADSVRIGPATNTVGVPTSISVSPVNRQVVWVGTGTGSVYRYDISGSGTAAATRLNTGLPNRFVSQIVAGYDSADTVYAVFNGYDANTPGTPGKVFVSRNRGTTWQNVSGDLPDVPANALALDPTDPNRMWLATDAALYSTRDGGQTWQSERRNMPVVTVSDVVYHAKSGELVVATFGRGIWKMNAGQ
ncbi:MAG TPA: hypothetical protein VF432_22985 [Thermoanaerobaculia bacterium]